MKLIGGGVESQPSTPNLGGEAESENSLGDSSSGIETPEENKQEEPQTQGDSSNEITNELPNENEKIHKENEDFFNKIKKYNKEKNEAWKGKQGSLGHKFEDHIRNYVDLVGFSSRLFEIVGDIADYSTYSEYRQKENYTDSEAKKDNSNWAEIVKNYEKIMDPYIPKLKEFVEKNIK